jgi:hypothetical protein
MNPSLIDTLPNYGLANTATGFCPLFAGISCLVYTWFLHKQPPRWMFAYWMVVITGVFTVTLHGFGETNQVWGPRWFWAFLDTGSNIVVTWAFSLGVIGDYYSKATKRWAWPAATVAMVVGCAWHFYDRMPSTERFYVIPLGDWGGFYPGETWLIGFSFLVTGLFVAKRKQIPREAIGLLIIVVVTFLVGLGLATASNDKIIWPYFSLHAIWHVVASFGFVTLWAFNHVRFVIEDDERAATAGV